MPPSTAATGDSARITVFIALVSICLLVAGGYAAAKLRRPSTPSGAALSLGTPQAVTLLPRRQPATPGVQPAAAQPATAPAQPQSNAPVGDASDSQGTPAPGASLAPPVLLGIDTMGNVSARHQLLVRSLTDPDAQQYHLGLSCERVAYAGGHGLCVTFGADPSSQIKAEFFDASFHITHTLYANGIPSRARVSADGRYGVVTYFVLGDSYAAASFSTRTAIMDMNTGTVVVNLEQFTVYRGSSVFQSQDFNFWGVTFAADSNSFYATLASGGKTYLIQGDIAARTAHTLTENVECPSLSPDGLHIVFKRRVSDGPPPVWRLYVLDVATLSATPLAETRNVDDQAEWLDNDHVLYTPMDKQPATWEVATDSNAAPVLFAPNMISPIVIR